MGSEVGGMDGLKLFENPEFGKVRTITEDGKVLFCGSDVAKTLGYAKPQNAIDRHCRGALKRGIGVQTGVKADGSPAIQHVEMLFITEGDVIRLVARSPLPEAAKVESWIFDEVIPSVLHHGAYMTPNTLDQMIASPEFGIRLLTELKEERDKRKEVEAQKVALEAKVEADRPKVAFADAVEGSYSTILVRDLAKILRQNGVEVGEKRLFERLRNSGYLIRQPGRSYNLPTQRALEAGLFEVKETAITHTTGTQTHLTPLVTGKGQRYFVNLFLRDKAVDERREA